MGKVNFGSSAVAMGYAISPQFGHILDLASLLGCPNRIYPARGSLAASHGTLTRTQAGSQGIACSDRVACPRHGAPPDRPKPMPMFKHESMVLRAFRRRSRVRSIRNQ